LLDSANLSGDPETSGAEGLREAMRRGELRLEFQPELDLRTKKVLAVEALARWDHPAFGALSAHQFIELAEASGVVTELGEWALRTSCAQYAKWRSARPDLELVLRVNVSPLQLSDPRFAELVCHVLAETGLQPEQLCLEVTENSEPTDAAVMTQVLRSIRETGVTTAIDDFGTGRNGLERLLETPFDVLKIDRTFVADLGQATVNSAIVAAMLRLADNLAMTVVAEGIERGEAVDELIRLGCTRGQGYLLAPPVGPDEMTSVLGSTST
jgi:EAL domain-containing protein (putative c-di-GMP-specific phosphodiesterase class I)